MTPDQQRRLFIELRKKGMSQAEAARTANDAARDAQTRPKAAPVMPVQPAAKPETPPKPKADIPDDWSDLPWPDLRALAERVSGGRINSRVEARAAIEAAKQ